MLDTDKLQGALEAFRDRVVKESKQGLRRRKKVVSGNLLNSIKGSPVKVTQNSLQFNISMADYGTFQDKGVSGTEKKYNTPYTYRDKMPPTRALDGWTVRKGIAPRDEKGRFLKRKTLTFLIARSIYRNGIKPSLFFTTPFKRYVKDLPEEIAEAFALDVEEFIDFINKQNFSNGNN
jgi:hypothetical protein